MRKTLLSTLVVAVLLGTSSVCPAQQPPAGALKPLVTVSVSGYEEIRGDIEFIGKLGGNPDLAKLLEGLLEGLTGGEGLPGLDKTKPWGLVVQTDGQQEFPVFGFVPVTDLNQLMGVVKTLETGEAPEPPADGVWELKAGGPTLYVQEKGGWAFIVTDRAALDNVPADPIKSLGGLNEKYDLAVRVSMGNIPAAVRQMFILPLQLGAAQGMPRMSGESDEDYAIRTGVAKQMLQQVITMINELDEVLLGFAVDQTTGTSYLDFEVTAAAGTKLAAQFSQMTPAKTNFAGFDLPGAAVTGNWAGTLTDQDVAQTKAALTNVRATALKELENEGLSAEELKLAKQLIQDALDIVEKTIENKISDGGMVLILKPGLLTFAAGGVIAETAKAEKVIQQMGQLAVKENPKITLTPNAETHQGVRFHTMAIPVPDPDAEKVFGQNLDVVAGVGQQSIYVAVGRNAAETLKQVIDASQAKAGQPVPPFRVAAAATPIVEFVADMGPPQEKQLFQMLAEALKQSAGKDHLTITSKPIPNGANVRVEIEEGILKLIGISVKMVQEMMPAGVPAAEAALEPAPF